MLFQIELDPIVEAIGNLRWIFISLVIFIIGIFYMRRYAKKNNKERDKEWDTSLGAALKVNIIILITNITVGIFFPILQFQGSYNPLESFSPIFFDLIRQLIIYIGIDILIATLAVTIFYKKRKKEAVVFVIKIQLIILIIVFILNIVYNLTQIPPYIFIYIIVIGLPQTLAVTVLGLLFGFFIGISLAIMRVYGGIELGWLSSGYEKLFRGIPVLVLIYLFAFGIPLLSPFDSIVLALALRSGAYQSQIFRGAFLSVNPGQMDAAYTLGMNRLQAFRYVLMPQAFRLAIPSWSNEYSVVIKDSSFAYEVGLIEMTRAAYYVSISFRELWAISMAVVALTYFLFTFPITKWFGERQTNKLKELGLGGG
jgi:polar amino acid transport system permease protein